MFDVRRSMFDVQSLFKDSVFVVIRDNSWLVDVQLITIIQEMFNFLKKHATNLQTILLILMLAVPFVLYYFARSGSTGGIIIVLAVFGAVMLIAMKS